MKQQSPAPRTPWAPSILWTVAIGSLIGLAALWFYLSYISSLSANDVRAEGERVTAILKEYKSASGRYPRGLEETRVADLKFPHGFVMGYTPNTTCSEYILVVSGGGHTWRYHSGAAVWELVPSGTPVGGVE